MDSINNSPILTSLPSFTPLSRRASAIISENDHSLGDFAQLQGPAGGKNENDQEKQEREEASKMQTWWDRAIRTHMNIPNGYESVAVLIVYWTGRLDDWKKSTMREVGELQRLLSQKFKYNVVDPVPLDIERKPQHQLNVALSNFIFENDGPEKLLMVYYTGHGRWNELKQQLELSATSNEMKKKGMEIAAQVNFTEIESLLRGDSVDADILVILDTCFSSNAARVGFNDRRTYELLSAAGPDQLTPSPGPSSFTRSLIDSLTALCEEHGPESTFTTYKLLETINKRKERKTSPAFLWNRLALETERHINLSPHRAPSLEDAEKSPSRGGVRSYLTLRLSLGSDMMNKEQIRYLARELSHVFKHHKTPTDRPSVHKVEWMGIRKSKIQNFRRAGIALKFAKRWKDKVGESPTRKRLAKRRLADALRVDSGTGAPKRRKSPARLGPVEESDVEKDS